jgi:carbonic anhydrase
MSVVDELLAHNASYQASFDRGDLPSTPSLRLAVVTCMDARMDVLRILGLRPGEAQVIRNGGGLITDDVMRSLVVSQWVSNTKEILLLRHTDCGMTKFDEQELSERVGQHAGGPLRYSLGSFGNSEEDLRASLHALREARELLHRDHIHGFLYDVSSGGLAAVN